MKIEYHSATLISIIGYGFDKAAKEQLPDRIAAVCSKKVKLLQFYTEFFGKDGNYLFKRRCILLSAYSGLLRGQLGNRVDFMDC